MGYNAESYFQVKYEVVGELAAWAASISTTFVKQDMDRVGPLLKWVRKEPTRPIKHVQGV